eukprot:14342713-Alexandrium_andersonii.AAC.1
MPALALCSVRTGVCSLRCLLVGAFSWWLKAPDIVKQRHGHCPTLHNTVYAVLGRIVRIVLPQRVLDSCRGTLGAAGKLTDSPTGWWAGGRVVCIPHMPHA